MIPILAALLGLPGQPEAEPTKDLYLLGWAQGIIVSAPDRNGVLLVEWNHPFVHPDFAVAAEIDDRKKQVSSLREKGLKLPKGSPERDQVTQAFVNGMEAIANLRNDAYKTVPAHSQVTVRLEPWTRYRQEKPPLDAFDDKGNLLPVNPMTLRKLREPLHWPGYQSQKSQLEEGRGVLMHMAMRKPDARQKEEGRGSPLLARLVLVLEQAPPTVGDPLAAPR